MKIPVFKNTMTNYVFMAVRLVQGILITRWLLSNLGKEYYGLWAILWSFFCYSLLLDFGFGTMARKCTSTELYRSDIDRYNRTISTVFSFHISMSLLILAGTGIAVFFVPFLLHAEQATPEQLAYYRTCFLCFGIGSALVFPFGIFPEILVGLQRIYLRNYVNIISKVVELAGVLVIFRLGGGLVTVILFTVVLMALTQLSMLFFALRLIPGFRLRFRVRPDPELFHEIFHFSGFVFLIMMAKLFSDRSNPLLISIFCGLVPAASFQLGSRLPQLVGQLTGPYQENISPLSALLHARRKRKLLGRILCNSMRWNSFLACGLCAGSILFAGELIRILFKIDDPVAVDICRIMALTIFVWLVFRAIPERYFLMTGGHRFLSLLQVAESVLVLVLSIIFLPYYGAIAVVATAFCVKVGCIGGVLLPRFLLWTGIGTFALLRDALLRPTAALLPTLIAWLAEIHYCSGRLSDFWLVALAGATAAVLYPIASFFLITNRIERAKIVKTVYTYLGATQS